MFSSTRRRARTRRVLELERGDLADDDVAGASVPTSPLAARPTLPATAGTPSPAARWIAPISSTVVVLPLVPVTAMNSWGSSRQASSSSPISEPPRERAAATTAPRAARPGS